MTSLHDLFEAARAFEKHGCKWVLVGGMAVLFHGGNTLTTDADVVFAHDRDNLDAVKLALKEIGAHPIRGNFQEPFEFDYGMLLAPFMHLETREGQHLDLIGKPPGIDSFTGLCERSVEAKLNGQSIRVASLEDLIRMKESSTRDKDKLHLAELIAIRALTQPDPQAN